MNVSTETGQISNGTESGSTFRVSSCLLLLSKP